MIKIRENEEGRIVVYLDDEQRLEVFVQNEQYVIKHKDKMMVNSLIPIQLQSAMTNEVYFVKKEDRKLHVFNNDGIDLFVK